jgi:16S rRNA (cytidine1402-2'-O)-methyltransferase
VFSGFLPATGAARKRALAALDGPHPVVLYEAPHRIERTFADLLERFGPAREIVIGRELTKKFEDVTRLKLGEAAAWLDGAPHRRQGEFVLVLGPGAERPKGSGADPEATLALLLEALPPSEAARIAARLTGVPKGELYRRALARRK